MQIQLAKKLKWGEYEWDWFVQFVKGNKHGAINLDSTRNLFVKANKPTVFYNKVLYIYLIFSSNFIKIYTYDKQIIGVFLEMPKNNF